MFQKRAVSRALLRLVFVGHLVEDFFGKTRAFERDRKTAINGGMNEKFHDLLLSSAVVNGATNVDTKLFVMP